MTRDIYCIVDGLDECIKTYRVSRQSTADERMENFLKRLCNAVCGPGTREKTSCTKIFITTRPMVEVDNAAKGREIVLEIQESDTIAAVEEFVEDGVRLLAKMKNLSLPAQDFIKAEITQKSGHVFQTAQTALRRLRLERYDLENREVVSRALLRVDSQKSNDAYEETLEILETAPQQDQVKAARIIRILFFLQSQISLLELEHALLIDIQGSEPSLVSTTIQSNLDAFIRTNLGLLVKIDHESMVSLQHQTVRDYFQTLSGDRRQVYSCAERKGGHVHLALICIRYLLLWRRHFVTQDDIDAHEGDEVSAGLQKAPFLSYASYYWDTHAREAGELILPHLSLVDKLLGFKSRQDSNEYYFPMLSLRWRQGVFGLEEDQDFYTLLPGSFLASSNLIEVLRGHTYQRKLQKRGKTQKLMFWRSQGIYSDAIEADFDLNMQNESGSGLTPLHCACKNGHLETAKLLLDCGASGEVYDTNGDSPFSLAVDEDWKEIAEMLIQRKQCWDDPKRGDYSRTLHMACLYGMSEIVPHVLGMGYDPNCRVLDGWTPVHVAVQSGQVDTLEVLLGAGGLADSKLDNGTTPLYSAAEEGFLPIIKKLFRHKPDMDPAPRKLDGRSPHHAAAAGGHLEVLEYLDEKHKDVHPDEDGILPIHFAARGGHLHIINRLSDRSNITAMDNNKELPIHFAALKGHLETFQRLLQFGRDFEVGIDIKCRDLSVTVQEDPDGTLTPLYLAVSSGHLKIVEYLINEGADVNVRSFRKRTILHEAARQTIPEMFELLLKHNLGPFEKDETGKTPLHIAAIVGNSKIIDIYLKMQDIDTGLGILDAESYSALVFAIGNKHAKIAEKLISKGVDIHLLDQYKRSLLNLSVILEDTSVFKSLLEGGVDVNIADVFGQTALHEAAIWEKLEACFMLIEKGANVNAETYVTKETPLHYAAQCNNVDIVLRLLDAGANPYQRDFSGASVLDFVTTYQPMIDLLSEYRKDYQPQSSEKRFDALRQAFCTKLHALPLTAPADTASKTKFVALLLYFREASRYLKKYDVFRVCYGFSIFRPPDWTFTLDWECSNCGKNHVGGSLWICKQCRSTELCNDCYKKRLKGLYARGCGANHDYLENAGEEWKELGKGKVNAKGQTFWEWIAELKEKYVTEDDIDVDISTLFGNQKRP